MFSVRDLYPNMIQNMSTGDLASPELDEQLVLTKGEDTNYPGVVTKADRMNLVWAILGIVALLFAFGMVK